MSRFMSSRETGLGGLARTPCSAVTGKVAGLISQPSAVLTNSIRLPASTPISVRILAGMTTCPFVLTIAAVIGVSPILLYGKTVVAKSKIAFGRQKTQSLGTVMVLTESL